MKISSACLLGVTHAAVSCDYLCQIDNQVASISNDSDFFRKVKPVKNNVRRLTKQYRNAKWQKSSCILPSPSMQVRDSGACGFEAVHNIKSNFNDYLEAHIDGIDGSKKCKNVLKRQKNKLDKIIAKIDGYRNDDGDLFGCPSGTCVDSRCVFDLKQGGFGDGDLTRVIGREDETNSDVVHFQGIKFANQQRFMESTYIDEYTDTDFSVPGYSCMQATNILTGSLALPTSTEMNEDCLYIRITMRKDAMTGPKRQVVSWIHGGTFNFGGVDVLYEQPTHLVAEQDLIVAKMNYRLGPFGNWYFPVSVNGQPKSNFQMRDQRLGLKWIKEHIALFNGNEEDITLGGASAGAQAAMGHMVSSDSWDYFNNAMLSGAAQVRYWTEAEAGFGYYNITVQYLGCSNPTDFATDLASGAVLECLQQIPIEILSPTLAQTGQIFGGIALANNKLSQLEATYAPNIDGEIMPVDPRDAIKAGNLKPDMGFYVTEMTRDEGYTMSVQTFRNENLRSILFGESAAQIWQSFNAHVQLPAPAYNGFMANVFGKVSQDLLNGILGTFPCPVPENDPYGGLLTECIDAFSDWLSSYLFTCDTRNFLQPYVLDKNLGPANMYALEQHAAKNGVTQGLPGTILPELTSMVNCYEATQGKSCHIMGMVYLFGEAENQNAPQSQEQAEYGVWYRSMYAEIIKTGKSTVVPNFKDQGGLWSRIDIGAPHISDTVPYAAACALNDMVNLHGMI